MKSHPTPLRLRNLILLLSTMLVYFGAPFGLIRWFAFKASVKAPLSSIFILIPTVWISYILFVLMNLPIIYANEFQDKPKNADVILDAIEDYRNGVPTEEIRDRLKREDVEILEYELQLRKVLKA